MTTERNGAESFSRKALLLWCVALLAGCGTVRTVQVSVPVPVACTEHVPERPFMPTSALMPGVAPFVLLRAALAEIDRRESFEGRMHAALVACTQPVE